jgi:hypothetical protein
VWVFWLLLALMLLILFSLLFVALRPGRVSVRQKKRWRAEGEAKEAELEARRRRAAERRERDIAQWQEHRDKSEE